MTHLKKTEKIAFPLAECLRRSFTYVVSNWRFFLALCLGWFGVLILYELLFDFPLFSGLVSEETQTTQLISGGLVLLAGCAILSGTCKMIISQYSPKPGALVFKRAEARILGYSIVIGISVIFAFVVLLALVVGITDNLAVTRLAALLIIYGLLLGVARCYLFFPAAVIEKQKPDFSRLFALTSGNAHKILFGVILCSLPFSLLLQIIYMAYEGLAPENIIVKLLLSFALLAASFGDSILRGSFYAHMYKYFTYVEKSKKNKANVKD